MGFISDPFKEIAFLIPDVNKQTVETLAVRLEKMQAMAIAGASLSSSMPIVGATPTNPLYFRLAGETNNANSWGNAGYFQYSNNGTTLITQIDNSGYIFNEQGGNIDFRVEGDTDSSLFFVDASTDRIGVGTSSPLGTVHISDGNAPLAALVTTDFLIISIQGTAPGLSIISASSDAALDRAVFKGVRARGTLASPLVPSDNDSVLSILGSIYDGVNNEGTAQIDFLVDGSVSSNVAPQRISFTTSATTAGSRVERLQIKSGGTIIVNETGVDADFRIESDANSHMFFMDAGNNRIEMRGAAATAGNLRLTTAELTVVDGDVLGQLDFQAPLETGADAILVAASIWAEANAEFTASVNNTDLVFATATSETATAKMRLTTGGNLAFQQASAISTTSGDLSLSGSSDNVTTRNFRWDNSTRILMYTGTGTSRHARLATDGGGYIFNELGTATTDFRMQSDNFTHMFFVDSGNDIINFGGTGVESIPEGVVLKLVKVSDTTRLLMTTYSATATHQPRVELRRSNSGSEGTVAQTDDNDFLGAFVVTGVSTGSAFANSGRFQYLQDGTAQAIRIPTELQFMISSTTVSNNVLMTLRSSMLVGINNISPAAQLDVDQPSSTGAVPVLKLDQGDVSEQAILISYSGADADMILIDVDVTGDPQFGWDETSDDFTLSKGIDVTGTVETDGFIAATVAKTGAYTATATDYVIICNATSASFTVTLPAAASHTGRVYHIKKIDSSGNTVTVDGASAETIDDGATAIITTQYESITIQSDGSEWWIL